MNQRREFLRLVAEDDRYLGEKEKEECHRQKGCLHSAFLVMMTNEKGELLQARRSASKKLWPRTWDGTVAGHFHTGERTELSIRKRVRDEIGVNCHNLEYLFKFHYQAAFKDIGFENEICHVFRANDFRPEGMAINPDEVSEFKFSTISSLKKEVDASPEEFTPWFLIALKKLAEVP